MIISACQLLSVEMIFSNAKILGIGVGKTNLIEVFDRDFYNVRSPTTVYGEPWIM